MCSSILYFMPVGMKLCRLTCYFQHHCKYLKIEIDNMFKSNRGGGGGLYLMYPKNNHLATMLVD